MLGRPAGSVLAATLSELPHVVDVRTHGSTEPHDGDAAWLMYHVYA
jgi:hypothetical protein